METKYERKRAQRNRQVAVVLLMLLVFFVAFTVVSAALSGGADIAEAAVLKKGVSGTDVKTMQTKLKKWGYYTGVVDGVFGSQTEAAVKYFQKTNKLAADGIVGAKTAAAMGITLSGSGSSGNSGSSGSSGGNTGSGGFSAADVNLLARCVNAEARGEPYLGQVAVASVVLNRVKSSSFPNSISGVVYQKNAFSSVADGQINLSPSESCMKAAKDAMNGWDPTGGCLYFYEPRKTSNAWMLSRTVTLVIGNHNFCL